MKIAIIGAGLSGLCSARELINRGCEVDIFEKSRGLGGRLANKRVSWGQFDIGAQYFTARDKRFQQQVAVWEQDGVVCRWSFTPYAIVSNTLQPSPDETVRYVGTPTMNRVAHQMADGIQVNFKTRVTNVSENAQGWQLGTERDEVSKHYDWLLLTLPLEQSATLLEDHKEIRSRLPDSVHRPCWSLTLATRGSVASHIQGIFGDELVSWVSRSSARPNAPKGMTYDDLWVLQFSPEWSLNNEKQTHDQMVREGLRWLSERLAIPLSCEHSFSHFWRYAGLSASHEDVSMIVDRTKQLAINGAWCCGGRVEGAFLSGLDVVDQILMP